CARLMAARGGLKMHRDEFRALRPWSFFLPMALAVALGMLVANGLWAAFFGGSESASLQEASAEAAATGGADADDGSATGAVAPAVAGNAGVAGEAGTPKASLPPVLEPASPPGPTSARRDGESRACIGGTIAVRAANGWEQEVVEDAPARCTAVSH